MNLNWAIFIDNILRILNCRRCAINWMITFNGDLWLFLVVLLFFLLLILFHSFVYISLAAFCFVIFGRFLFWFGLFCLAILCDLLALAFRSLLDPFWRLINIFWLTLFIGGRRFTWRLCRLLLFFQAISPFSLLK